MGLLFVVHGGAHGAELEFDPIFLQGGVKSSDLQKVAKPNYIAPGVYQLDLEVNGVIAAREEVKFATPVAGESAEPCLTADLLDRLGVDLFKLPAVDRLNKQACVALHASIADSRVTADMGTQHLNISIPQAYLRRTAQGYVDPAQWDTGITAGMLNYDFNHFYSTAQSSGAQHYLGLQAGLNVAKWRLRSDSSLRGDKDGHSWQLRSLYAQREIRPLSSQLTLGDSSTTGNLFDSFTVRGLQLGSDERMLPDSQSGYAPVVRGVANTNAKVTIRQNGYVIYETTVAPGSFEISDLYPSGYGGDLQVSVAEADGNIRRFSVPYAAVARMLRPGAQRYNVAVGQYRDGYSNASKEWVGQLTYERGLSNLFTGYTGALATQGYFSPMVGAAMNTPIGAFGLDLTHATTKTPDEVGIGTVSGQSVRLSYSKSVPDWGSTVSVAAYRYSSSDFYSLRDVMSMKLDASRAKKEAQRYFDYVEDDYFNGDFSREFERRSYLTQSHRQRSSMQFTVNQAVGTGSLYLTGTSRAYWERSGTSTDYQVGYRNSTRYFTYSVSAMRSQNSYGGSNQVSATISMPLGDRVNASSTVSFSNRGVDTQAGVFGASGDRDQYSWSANANIDEERSKSSSFSGSYTGRSGVLNASATVGNGYHQGSLGASGSVVAHPGGVSFGQRVSDTFAIVEVPGAAGAAITSQVGVSIGADGYAVLPYLTPYRRNHVDIDPAGISTDIELKSTSEQLIPAAGAVLMAKFETVKGRTTIIDLEIAKGLIIPFGTEVINQTGVGTGIVAQGGRILARGLDEQGVLLVKWGDKKSEQCRVNYSLVPMQGVRSKTGLERISAVCVPLEVELLVRAP